RFLLRRRAAAPDPHRVQKIARGLAIHFDRAQAVLGKPQVHEDEFELGARHRLIHEINAADGGFDIVALLERARPDDGMPRCRPRDLGSRLSSPTAAARAARWSDRAHRALTLWSAV